MTQCPAGTIPEQWQLENGADINPHGSGWAVAGRNWVQHFTSLDPAEAVSTFMRFRRRHLDGPALFHSRYASASPVTLENVQPFIVGGNRDIVMAHNGYLFTAADGDTRSDSHILAAEILPLWDLGKNEEKRRLARIINPGRAVILWSRSSAPRPWKQSLILNKRSGFTLPDGTWHSNSDYTGIALNPEGFCPLCKEESETRICARCQAAAAMTRDELYRVPGTEN